MAAIDPLQTFTDNNKPAEYNLRVLASDRLVFL
jgi:hypothetical protein